MPIYDHDCFIKVEDKDLPVWRYLQLDKFESLLNERALFFCRADKFSDPFEGSIPFPEAEYRLMQERYLNERYGRGFDEAKSIRNVEAISQLHKNMKRQNIVNCWHINECESDAMWRLYLKDNEGVAIQTNIQRLENVISNAREEIGISKVRYLDYEKQGWYHPEQYPLTSYNTYTPLVHKRNEFSHETELRLIHSIPEAEDEEYWDKQLNHKGKFIEVGIEDLIENVYFHPMVDQNTMQIIKDLVCELGYFFEFKQSRLSSEPIY